MDNRRKLIMSLLYEKDWVDYIISWGNDLFTNPLFYVVVAAWLIMRIYCYSAKNRFIMRHPIQTLRFFRHVNNRKVAKSKKTTYRKYSSLRTVKQ